MEKCSARGAGTRHELTTRLAADAAVAVSAPVAPQGSPSDEFEHANNSADRSQGSAAFADAVDACIGAATAGGGTTAIKTGAARLDVVVVRVVARAAAGTTARHGEGERTAFIGGGAAGLVLDWDARMRGVALPTRRVLAESCEGTETADFRPPLPTTVLPIGTVSGFTVALAGVTVSVLPPPTAPRAPPRSVAADADEAEEAVAAKAPVTIVTDGVQPTLHTPCVDCTSFGTERSRGRIVEATFL